MIKPRFTWQQEEDFLKASLTFSLEDATEWIRKNLPPEEVFEQKDLERWAEENGFIKE
jgi:hypothetical protein